MTLRRRNAFTFLELLLAVAIIGVLLSLILPALQNARSEARAAQCLANLRFQGMVLSEYVEGYDGAMPPRRIWDLSTFHSMLIAEILARQARMPMPAGDWRPVGPWRCPDVADDAERSTHLGILHYAPNRWLFNTITSCDGENLEISAEIPEPWLERYPPALWRHIKLASRPSETVSMIDNVSQYIAWHGHRDALESVGFGYELISDENDAAFRGRRMSHQSLAKHPAVMLDGHAESLPASKGFWRSGESRELSAGLPPGLDRLYPHDIRHFAWFGVETPPPPR